MNYSDLNTASSAPDLDYLRKKFLHIDATSESVPPILVANLVDANEVQEIVQIRPAGDRSGLNAKAAVISGRTGKIVGEQG